MALKRPDKWHSELRIKQGSPLPPGHCERCGVLYETDPLFQEKVRPELCASCKLPGSVELRELNP